MTCKPGFDASFIQIGEAQLSYEEADWQRELEVLQATGVRSIVLQFCGDEHGNYDARRPGKAPVRALLRAAAARGMDVFVGLFADPSWPARFDPKRRLPAPLDKRDGREWLRRLSREHKAFAGFYIPHEIDEQTWAAPAARAALSAFLQRVSHELRSIDPHKPIAIAPFYAESRKPEAYAVFIRQLLSKKPVDIVMLQDGAGARRTTDATIASTLQAVRRALDPLHIELWAVVELFHQVSGSPVNDAEFRAVPDTMARICASMAIEQPWVRRMIAFSVLDYMHPSHGAAQKQLYEAYRKAREVR